MRYSGFLRKDEGISVQSWADITDDGELILDWNDVVFYSHKFDRGVNGYRNPPKSGGKDGLRFLVWRALLRGAEMELLNRHADVRGKKD